jgi:uncharacterized protein (TIGR03382 family)
MMNTQKNMVTASVIFTAAFTASSANAGITIEEEIAIISPCDNAQVEVIWIGSDAGYTGELSWLNPLESGADISLWTNHSAVSGQSAVLPTRFDQGERVHFSYEIIKGGLDIFSTANEDDWTQFSIDSTDPHDVIVGIEDIRLPGGDGDYNDAMFRVLFTCGSTVPTPGTFALLGMGGVIAGRRRR